MNFKNNIITSLIKDYSDNGFVAIVVNEGQSPVLGTGVCIWSCWVSEAPFVVVDLPSVEHVFAHVPVRLVLVMDNVAVNEQHKRTLLFQQDSPNFSWRTVVSIVADSEGGVVPAISEGQKTTFSWCPEMERICRNLDSTAFGYAVCTSGTVSSSRSIVAVDRAGAEQHFIEVAAALGTKSSDTVLWNSPPTFDPSLVEFFGAMLCGASVVCRCTGGLFQSIATLGVTVAHCTPSAFQLAVAGKQPGMDLTATRLRVLSFGGEPLHWSSVQLWRSLLPSGVQLVNLYGVTEISVWQSFYQLGTREDQDQVPIASNDNFFKGISLKIRSGENEEFILPSSNRKSNDRPIEGNLYVRSDESKGGRKIVYLSSRHNIDSSDWIDTGDIGRWKSGKLYFSGRSGQQLKVLGKRVDFFEFKNELLSSLPDCRLIHLHQSSLDQSLNIFVGGCQSICRMNEPPGFHRCSLLAQDALKARPGIANYIQRFFHCSTFGANQMAQIMSAHEKLDQKMFESIIESAIEKERGIHGSSSIDEDEIRRLWIVNVGSSLDSMSSTRLAMSLSDSLSGLAFGKVLRFLLRGSPPTLPELIDFIRDNVGSSSLTSSPPLEKRRKIHFSNRFDSLIQWRVFFPACVDSNPSTIHGELVFVGSFDGSFRAMNSQTGYVEWSIECGSPVQKCAPIVMGGKVVVVALHDGRLLTINIGSGGVIETKRFSSNVRSLFAVDDAMILVVFVDGELLWMENKTQFRLKLNCSCSSSCALGRNRFVMALFNGNIVCVQSPTKSNPNPVVLWTHSILHESQTPICVVPVLNSTRLLVASSSSLCLVSEKGERLHEVSILHDQPASSSSLSVSADGARAAMMTDSGRFYSIITNDLTCFTCQLTTSNVQCNSTPLFLNQHQIFLVAGDNFFIIDAATDLKLIDQCHLPDVSFSSPILHEESSSFIYFGSRDNNFYCLNLDTGSLKSKN